MAGELVMAAAAANGVSILPIDSEHSAIFQCIKGHRVEDLDKIILTASGGPFLETPRAAFKKIKPEVPRIILTGYADKENAIKAINEVGLFQYIEKPWENEDLLLIFRNGIEKQRLMKQLQEKMDEINKAYGDLQNLQTEIVKTFV